MTLERADSGRCSLAPGSLGGALPTAFLLLSSLEPTPRPGLRASEAAAAHQSEAQLERMCGISYDPGCGTLLLYSRAPLFEFGF